MSIAIVNSVMTSFLVNEEIQVLALKGSWGVGKTFAWNQFIHEHKDQCNLPNYCYVSLFGISSLSELRTAIFAKAAPIRLLGLDHSLETINNEWAAIGLKKLKGLGRWFAQFKDAPYLKHIQVGLDAVAPHFIHETLICLDDFERLNPNIKPDEILGLVSELKEEKQCKVVLIFNENELHGATPVYQRYREKVVDVELLFAPTADEAADLALPHSLIHRETIKKYVVSLGVKNIRILRRIAHLAKLMGEQTVGFHPSVMEQAVMTLVLLVWCSYDSNDNKPPLSFVIDWNLMVWGMGGRDGKEKNPQHETWARVLQNYGLLHVDEFDQSIIKVIECGYLEGTGFAEEAAKLEAKLQANDLEQSFSRAWSLFHNTFANNQDELVQSLIESSHKCIVHISPMNLSSTTMLLRQLGRTDEANTLIDFYINSRDNEVMLFDLENLPFANEIRDPVIVERFNAHFVKVNKAPTLIDTAKLLAENRGFSKEHIATLQSATEDDFYELFKQDHGEKLAAIVKSCLQFEFMPAHENIGKAARNALIRIGKESKLNAIRVLRYGINIET